jgi:hypothetical protein
MRTYMLMFSLLTLSCARVEIEETRTVTVETARTEANFLETANEVCGEMLPMCRRNACVIDVVHWLVNERVVEPTNIQGGI